MPTKICTKCHLEKDYQYFCKASNNKGGVYSICNECRNWRHMTPLKREEVLLINLLFIYGKKKCFNCNKIKDIWQFRFVLHHNDCLSSYCYDCERENGLNRDRRDDVKQKRHNRDKLPEVRKNRSEYRKQSPKFKKTQEKYESSEKRKQQRLEYGRKLDVRIERRLRCRIWYALKFDNIKKQSKFDDLLGCSVIFFIKHIESLWTEGMSWETYKHDGWHLDHIRPCADFDLTDIEQQKICFNWKNHQPMWAEENFRKNSLYEGERKLRKNRVK